MAAASHSPTASAVVGHCPQLPLQVPELRRLTLSLHEQHAVELERGRIVEVVGTLRTG